MSTLFSAIMKSIKPYITIHFYIIAGSLVIYAVLGSARLLYCLQYNKQSLQINGINIYRTVSQLSINIINSW